MPKWLKESRGMDMQHIGLQLDCIYAMTTVCSFGGGWLSSALFFFQAEDGIRDIGVTGVQTCALPISGQDCEWACVRARAVPEPQPAPPDRSTCFPSFSSFDRFQASTMLGLPCLDMALSIISGEL